MIMHMSKQWDHQNGPWFDPNIEVKPQYIHLYGIVPPEGYIVPEYYCFVIKNIIRGAIQRVLFFL
jgi:hypothetical protein